MNTALKNESLQHLGALKNKLEGISTLKRIGKVNKANGTVIRVTGVPVKIGELCILTDPNSDWKQQAEVIGLDGQSALLTPLGDMSGISNQTQVIATGQFPSVNVSNELLGQVVDASGDPFDDQVVLPDKHSKAVYSKPINPMHRRPIIKPFTTRIKAIDSLMTVGIGQRLGIFAAAGTGKSTLLSMLARNSEADVNVIALIGERGREVQEFVSEHLNESMNKSVVIAATSDKPAVERVRATFVATTIAEHFRDQGKKVLLLVDSVTRFARALRDVGLAAGEPPTRRGFPPSVFSVLPQLMERSGNNSKGSITAFYTVLMEDEDIADPIAEEVRSILDGHIYLSRELASKNHYPPIDILNSLSRLMSNIATAEHDKAAGIARELLAKYLEIELLLQIGEYKESQDEVADKAIFCHSKLNNHLIQTVDDKFDFKQSLDSLKFAIQ